MVATNDAVPVTSSLSRRAAAEIVGTALLVATVVGAALMAEDLEATPAMGLLTNSIATGAVLAALILALGPVSGAHFNPVVTMTALLRGALKRGEALGYVAAQCAGGVLGTVLAHAMFGRRLLQVSRHARSGVGQSLSEVVATFGLLLVILAVSRTRPGAVPAAVGAYIAAAYWFTASTSFANPAVTLARSLTTAAPGISPTDVPAFLAAQIVGALMAYALWRWMERGSAR